MSVNDGSTDMNPMELGHLRDATRSVLLILRDVEPAQEQVADLNQPPRAEMGGADRPPT